MRDAITTVMLVGAALAAIALIRRNTLRVDLATAPRLVPRGDGGSPQQMRELAAMRDRLLAENGGIMPRVLVDAEVLDAEALEEVRRQRAWTSGYDAALADLNRHFDTLLADMPKDDDDTGAGGWFRWGAIVVEHAEPEALVDMAPGAVLSLVKRANNVPMTYSWSADQRTAEHPLVLAMA